MRCYVRSMVVGLVLSGVCLLARGAEVDVLALGADPLGQADSTAAFLAATEALAVQGGGRLPVAAGTFVVTSLALPPNTSLCGQGNATTLRASPETEKALVTIASGCRVENLCVLGAVDAPKKWHGIVAAKATDVSVRDVTLMEIPGFAVKLDNVKRGEVSGCRIERAVRAIDLSYSKRVKVVGNTVDSCSEHGIQFWGNWKWEKKSCEDLHFIGNDVKDGGRGAIWGSGGVRIVMNGNIVDGAEDVGLDLEWCDDSVITGNTVRRAKNAGIALFFACNNVAIFGNAVWNDASISEKDAAAAWWVRSGIWLTSPNRETYKDDHGHRNISITGNVIRAEEGKRRAVWIGAEGKNVLVNDNVIEGAPIVYGGHHKVQPLRLEELADQPQLFNERPTEDQPKF